MPPPPPPLQGLTPGPAWWGRGTVTPDRDVGLYSGSSGSGSHRAHRCPPMKECSYLILDPYNRHGNMRKYFLESERDLLKVRVPGRLENLENENGHGKVMEHEILA